MTKAKVAFREVSPILQHLREFLLGRPHVQALRFEPDVAPRTQPPPQIPDGVAHKYFFFISLRESTVKHRPPPMSSTVVYYLRPASLDAFMAYRNFLEIVCQRMSDASFAGPWSPFMNFVAPTAISSPCYVPRSLRLHKHADNYYCKRDPRKSVTPPLDVTKALLAVPSDNGEPKAARNAIPTPGRLFNWDRHDYVAPK